MVSVEMGVSALVMPDGRMGVMGRNVQLAKMDFI